MTSVFAGIATRYWHPSRTSATCLVELAGHSCHLREQLQLGLHGQADQFSDASLPTKCMNCRCGTPDMLMGQDRPTVLRTCRSSRHRACTACGVN